MASRTQIRLGQITGSFGTNAIVDSQAVSSAADLAAYNAVSGSMVGIMSDIASGLVRIHGGNTFAGGGASILKDLGGSARVSYVDGQSVIFVEAELTGGAKEDFSATMDSNGEVAAKRFRRASHLIPLPSSVDL